jgi:hypothetical protein
VRLADLGGIDSWSWAVRAFLAAAEAESQSDAFIAAGRVLQQLEPRALLDVAITMAIVPTALPDQRVTRSRLEWLTAYMASNWVPGETS